MKSNARENENRKEGERLSVAGTRTTKKGKFKSEIYGRVRGACFRDYGTCWPYSVGWKGSKKGCQAPPNAGLFWYIQLSEPQDHWLANEIIASQALGYGS